jgi:hypothetical protein
MFTAIKNFYVTIPLVTGYKGAFCLKLKHFIVLWVEGATPIQPITT